MARLRRAAGTGVAWVLLAALPLHGFQRPPRPARLTWAPRAPSAYGEAPRGLARRSLATDLENDGADATGRLAPDLQALGHWLQFHGADVRRLRVVEAEEGVHGWGLQFDGNKAAAAGDVLASIPLALCLSGRRDGPGQAAAMAKDPVWDLVDRLPSTVWRLRLGLVLLAERAHRASLYNAYVRNLPQTFPGMPLFYSEAEIGALQDGPLMERTTQRAQFLLRYASEVVASVTGSPEDPFDGQYADVNAIGWAVCCASSRAFLPRPYADEATRAALGVRMLEKGVAAAARAPTEAEAGLLVPVLDLLNHEPRLEKATCALQYSRDGASVELVAAQAISAGDALTAFYGPLANDALLEDFGFVDLDNPHEAVELTFSAAILAEGRRAARLQKEAFGRETRVRGRVVPNSSKPSKASLDKLAESEEESAREAFRMAVSAIANKEKRGAKRPRSDGMLMLRGSGAAREATLMTSLRGDGSTDEENVAAEDMASDATSVFPWQLRWLERFKLAGSDAELRVRLQRGDEGEWMLEPRALAALRVLFAGKEGDLQDWHALAQVLDALAKGAEGAESHLSEAERAAVRGAAYARMGKVDASVTTPNQRRVLALASALAAVRLRDFKGSTKDDEVALGLAADTPPAAGAVSSALAALAPADDLAGALGGVEEELELDDPEAGVLRPVDRQAERNLLFFFEKQITDLEIMVDQCEAGELNDLYVAQVQSLQTPLKKSARALESLALSDDGLESFQSLKEDMQKLQRRLASVDAGDAVENEEEDDDHDSGALVKPAGPVELKPAMREAVKLRLSKKRALRAAVADITGQLKRIGEPGSGVDQDERLELERGIVRGAGGDAMAESADLGANTVRPPPPDPVDRVLGDFGPDFEL